MVPLVATLSSSRCGIYHLQFRFHCRIQYLCLSPHHLRSDTITSSLVFCRNYVCDTPHLSKSWYLWLVSHDLSPYLSIYLPEVTILSKEVRQVGLIDRGGGNIPRVNINGIHFFCVWKKSYCGYSCHFLNPFRTSILLLTYLLGCNQSSYPYQILIITNLYAKHGAALSSSLRMGNITFLLSVMARVDISLLCVKNGFIICTLQFFVLPYHHHKKISSYSTNGDSVSAMNSNHRFCQKTTATAYFWPWTVLTWCLLIL